MAVVTFDVTAFKARYPEFASVDATLLGSCFTEAGFYLSNDDASIVQDITRRSVLLNMLTAHIAFLGGALEPDGMPQPVGRVSNASEGDVSAAFDYAQPGTLAWFNQTQYGAAFIQATSNLRSFRYRARPTVAW